MNNAHWLLVGFWIAYCLIHSFLADVSVKRSIERFSGKGFKYYRLVYSIFAFLMLALILWFQFSMSSPWLYHSFMFRTTGLVLCLPGIYIMSICIYKYFYELSGIQALETDNPVIHLQQTGLHKYVRHPLYFGTLLFVWGLFVIIPSIGDLIACLIITCYVVIGIHLEEKKLYMEFGESYREYSRKVPKLIPKIF